jgi:hypothetical protein
MKHPRAKTKIMAGLCLCLWGCSSAQPRTVSTRTSLLFDAQYAGVSAESFAYRSAHGAPSFVADDAHTLVIDRMDDHQGHGHYGRDHFHRRTTTIRIRSGR